MAGALIPVNLITGFLGSGKTTLLQRLLQSPELGTTAVLINEWDRPRSLPAAAGRRSNGAA